MNYVTITYSIREPQTVLYIGPDYNTAEKVYNHASSRIADLTSRSCWLDWSSDASVNTWCSSIASKKVVK